MAIRPDWTLRLRGPIERVVADGEQLVLQTSQGGSFSPHDRRTSDAAWRWHQKRAYDLDPRGRITAVRKGVDVHAVSNEHDLIADADGLTSRCGKTSYRFDLAYPDVIGRADGRLAVQSDRPSLGARDDVCLLDQDLTLLARSQSQPGLVAPAAVAADGLYRLNERGLRRIRWDGSVDDLAPFPREHVLTVLQSDDRRVFTSDENSHPFTNTDDVAAAGAFWHVAANLDPDVLLVSSVVGGIVMRLARNGDVQWARACSPMCCGQPVRKIGQHYLVRIGCSPEAYLLDAEGNEVRRYANRPGQVLVTDAHGVLEWASGLIRHHDPGGGIQECPLSPEDRQWHTCGNWLVGWSWRRGWRRLLAPIEAVGYSLSRLFAGHPVVS